MIWRGCFIEYICELLPVFPRQGQQVKIYCFHWFTGKTTGLLTQLSNLCIKNLLETYRGYLKSFYKPNMTFCLFSEHACYHLPQKLLVFCWSCSSFVMPLSFFSVFCLVWHLKQGWNSENVHIYVQLRQSWNFCVSVSVIYHPKRISLLE